MGMVIFFILAVVAVLASLKVVNSRSPVTSAMFLVLTMCCLAGLFVQLGALFVAALQIIVYAGAIMVLFLFVIMLLNLRKDEFGSDPRKMQKILGFILAAVVLVQVVFIIGWAMGDYNGISEVHLPSTTTDLDIGDRSGSSHAVAETLFTKYLYPFEVTSILLLAAIIGAVVIARRKGEPSQEEL